MGRLLKIEWLKIRHYRAFMWLLAIFVVSVFGINYITYDKVGMLNNMTADQSMFLGRPFQFPMVWHTVSYLTGFLLIIPGLLIIMLTANEYTYRTHRQSVINGLSRDQFVLSKIILMISIAVALTVLVFLMAMLFGLSGEAPFSFSGVVYVGYFFVQAMVYMSGAFLLAILFKRSGISIGIYFLYAFIIENLLSLLINYKIHMGIGYYLPIKAANKLIPGPVSLGKILDMNVPQQEYLLITSIVWIALCLNFCMYKFRDSDL